MNRVFALKRAGNANGASILRAIVAGSTLRKTFVFAIMIAAWIGVEAQTRSMAGVIEQKPRQAQTSPRVVKSYVCPMHLEVKSARRGKCPKCGMALRLARPDTAADGTANPNGIADLAAADDASRGAGPTVASDNPGPSRKMVIPDVEVLDQNGNQLHFYSDLIKGKTVAINFIFTNCTTICPPLAATFARVQKEMEGKVGRDVNLISISVDPLTDTPERLKTWGAKFKAAAGWTFVTGNKQEIDQLLSALGSTVARREDHSPTVIVGNDPKGVWTRTYGLANPTQLVGLIVKVMEGRTDDSLAKEPGKQ